MSDKTFPRRIFLLGAAKLTLLSIVMVRLFFLQIKENNYFSLLSKRNITNLIPIIPARGIIFDRFNVPLSSNKVVWQALFIKSELKQDIHTFLSAITKVITLSPAEKAKIIKAYHEGALYSAILIKSQLSESNIASLETFHTVLPAVFISGVYKRNYDIGPSCAHVVGYIGPINDPKRNQSTPSWRLGKYGIEQSLDSILHGSLGYQNYEINAKGEVIKRLPDTPPKEGQNIAITIDSLLQNQIYDLVKNMSAAVAILDIETGEIITLLSTPSFNPNLFVDGIDDKDWNRLIKDPEAPLSDKTVSGLYAPGSVIKPAVAMLALEKGVITPNTHITCKGYLDIGNRRFHCWKKKGHGSINVEQSLIHSCDVFYYQVGMMLSRNDFRNLGKNIAFNQNLLPLLDQAKVGRLPLNALHPPFGNLAITAIGQGEWLASPLHLANMMATIANNGKMVELKLLKYIDYKDKRIYTKLSKVVATLPFSQTNINLIKNALYKVVNSPGGTGHLANSKLNYWPVSGKTGTAQVVQITEKERLQGITQSKIRKYRDNASFVGFMPSFSPKYAISVVVPHAGFSEISAVPLAGKIAPLIAERHPYYEAQKQELQKIFQHAET